MARGFSIYARARARTCALVGVDANIGTFNSGTPTHRRYPGNLRDAWLCVLMGALI